VKETHHFPAEELNQLHIRAEDLWRVPAMEGWQKSSVSPMEVLKLFDGIWIKKGYTLVAYVYREGMSGFGVVWAVAGDEFPEVEDCERLEFLGIPRPEGALHFTDVLDGDKSPRSFINASIFYREMLEFGATWHGLCWGLHEITEKSDLWDGDLKPRVVLGEKKIVEFYTICGLYRWRVFRHRDAFRDYRIEPSVSLIAEGGRGYEP